MLFTCTKNIHKDKINIHVCVRISQKDIEYQFVRLLWLKTYLQFGVLSAEASLLAPVKSNDDNKYEAKVFRLLSNAYLTRGMRARALQLLTSPIKFPKLEESSEFNFVNEHSRWNKLMFTDLNRKVFKIFLFTPF